MRELSNGNILLFDNGNSRPDVEGGQYSRALELKLDLATMKATKVWEYRHSPDLYADCCGSVGRLANGNTLINFGFDSRDACCRVFTIVEANPSANTIAEMHVSGYHQPIQYRVYPITSVFGETQTE